MNPPVGIPIAGSYDVMRSKARIDDFYARAVAIADEERRTVIVSVDVCHIETEDFDYCRRKISEATGIDFGAIIIVCTHTHAGGHNSITNVNSSVDENDRRLICEFTEIMNSAIIDSAVAAAADLKPAKFYFAKDKAEGIINIRRFRMKDGSVVTNPGKNNPNVDHPLATPNPTVKLVKIEREGGKDVYLVNFGMHATTVGWRTHLSSDYPGVICRTLESALDVECMFLQGAAGDAVQINAFPSPEIERIIDMDAAELAKNKRMATYAGHKIAGTVLRIHNTAEEIPSERLFVRECPIKVPTNKSGGDLEDSRRIAELHAQNRHHELPYKDMALVTVVANAARIIRMADEPDFYSYAVYAVSLGELALVALPGEPFTELGLAVESVIPTDKALILSLVNFKTTYFPTTKAYSEGGYEVATTSVGAGTAEIIVDTVKKVFDEIS